MKKILVVLFVLVMLFTVGCGTQEAAPAKEEKLAETPKEEAKEETKEEMVRESDELVVYSSHPLEFLEPIINEFEASTGISIEIVAAGTGELLKRVEAEAANPLGDVMWGGSISALAGLEAELYDYESVNEEFIFENYKNNTGHVTAFTVLPMVLMVNDNLIGDITVEGYEDLLNPELKGKIANADPSKSSSSLANVYSQLYAMGNGDPEAGWDYVAKFIANLDGKLLGGSSAVYKGVADGEYTVGLTFEEAVVKYIKDEAPVSIVYPKEGLNVIADGVAIIEGAKNLENAKTFLDFVTSAEVQGLIASDLNRRPVRTDVAVGEGLAPLQDLTILDIPMDWTVENKPLVLEKYKEIVIG